MSGSTYGFPNKVSDPKAPREDPSAQSPKCAVAPGKSLSATYMYIIKKPASNLVVFPYELARRAGASAQSEAPHQDHVASSAAANAASGLVGNLLVERLIGAKIELVTRQEYVAAGSVALGENLKRRLEALGRRPYLIPGEPPDDADTKAVSRTTSPGSGQLRNRGCQQGSFPAFALP